MNESLPLTEEGFHRGEVQWASDGCRTTFTIDALFWSAGVKKVWLVGEGGARLLLGTLLPEQGRLRLSRTLSHSALRTAGLERILSAEIEGEAADMRQWQSLETFTCADSVLTAAVSKLTEGSWRQEGDVLTVRFPWRVGRSVPVSALFCLSEVKDGVWYVRMRNQPPPSLP